jgi:hypothetical protein
MHAIARYCTTHEIGMISAAALIGVQLYVYAAAALLFFAVERPFLQLRHRLSNPKVRTDR